jgi:hypothetical protein
MISLHLVKKIPSCTNWCFLEIVFPYDIDQTDILKELFHGIKSQGPKNCYADIVLTQDNGLNDTRKELALWDTMFTSSDTTLLTSEWIMFELSNNPLVQERLYNEIMGVTKQDRMVTEDDIPNMPYLNAVIKETLRKYPPIAVLPARYVDKDVTLGGYDIPKGWQVLINYFVSATTPSHLLVLKQFKDVLNQIPFEMIDELKGSSMIEYAKFLALFFVACIFYIIKNYFFNIL